MRNLEAAAKVNRYQERRSFHPLTCGKCPPPWRDDFPLHAEAVGTEAVVLYCPFCDYTQTMTPDLVENVVAMADMPNWQELFVARPATSEAEHHIAEAPATNQEASPCSVPPATSDQQHSQQERSL